jgi:hypothetical protein
MVGRGNDGGQQGGRMMMMHKQVGPNDNYVVWALGKFFLFVSFFLQLSVFLYFLESRLLLMRKEGREGLGMTHQPPAS